MGANQQDQYDNPWLRGAAAIGQQDYSGYDMKPWQRVLMGALGGLGTGFAGGVGRQQVDALAKQRNDSVMSGLKSGKLIEAITADPRLAEYAPFIEMEQAQNKQGRLQELNKALLPKGMMMTDEGQAPTRFFDPIEDEIRKAGGIERAKLEAQRMYSSSPVSEFQPPALEEQQGRYGQYTNTKGKRNALIREGIQQGLTPNAAAEYAEKNLASGTAMTKNAIEKLEAARKQAVGLESMASTAEYGIEGAGETGGFFNAPREQASKLYATISPEETQQRAAQAELDRIKPDIIAFSKQAGTGAMSDPEMRVYLGAGPSSDKTPQENQRIIDGIKEAAKITKEYSNFLESYIEDKGDAVGADQAWDQYKKANPLIVRGPDGKLTRNLNRTPWEDFFGGSEASQQPAAESTGATGSWDDSGGGIEERSIGGQRVRVRALGGGKYEVLD
jgi:hypothetical protein